MGRSETFQQILKTNHYSLTASRSYIFNQLVSNDPLSAAELATVCSPNVDRATTYRNLELFEKLGIVKRIWIGFKSKYELTGRFSPHHHHLQCTNCKRLITIKDSRLESLLNEIAKDNQLQPTDHQVEISGLCIECRKSRLNN